MEISKSNKYELSNNSYALEAKANAVDRIKVEIGDSKQKDKFYPQVKIMRWDNEVNFSARLVDATIAPVLSATDDKISYDADNKLCHFYELSKEQKPVHTAVRYINHGSLSPSQMSASFDVFSKIKQTNPIISVYRPNEEMYWLLGNYSIGRDLNEKLIDRPISRFRTNGTPYPIMFVDQNTLIFDIFYPHDVVMPNVLKCISEVLKSRGIKGITEPSEGRLYFNIKGKEKKFLSYGPTKNHLILYVTLSAPTYDFRSTYNKGVAGEYEYGGLDELIKIDSLLINDIAQAFAKDMDLTLESSALTEEEYNTSRELNIVYADTDWVNLGKTDYYIQDVLDDDAYEFEITLKEKPASNKIEFTLNTKDLEFIYQPELTQEEKDGGAYRPDNVVGSYAMYCIEPRTNIVGGKEYKTGKFGHIYRPRIIDAIGVSVWGDLNITDDIMTVTIPQEFLDTATYPIKHAAGATFGYTTAGATSTGPNQMISGSLFTGAAGTGTSISARLNATGNTKCNVYKSDNTPLTNGQTQEFTSFSLTWKTYNFNSAPTFTAVDYILCLWQAYVKTVGSLYYDTGASNQGHYQSLTYGTWPNPYAPTHDTKKFSIYATYSTVTNGQVTVTTLANAVGAGLVPTIASSPTVQITSLANAVGTGLVPTIVGQRQPNIQVTTLANAIASGLTPTVVGIINPSILDMTNTAQYILDRLEEIYTVLYNEFSVTIPVVTITSVNKTRISDDTGMDICTVKFTCDVDIDQWIAKANGTAYSTGTTVDGASSTITAGTEVTFTILDEELIGEGTYRINIYAHNSAGWTPYAS